MFIQNLIHDIVYRRVYHVYVLWSFDLHISNLLIMSGHDEVYYKNESRGLYSISTFLLLSMVDF